MADGAAIGGDPGAVTLPGGYAYNADRTRVALRDAPWEADPPAIGAVPLAGFKAATSDSGLALLSVRGAAIGVSDLDAAVRASPGFKAAFDRAVAGAIDLLDLNYAEAAAPARSPQQISAAVAAYQAATQEPFAQAVRDTVLLPGDANLEARADFVINGLTVASEAATPAGSPGSVAATIEIGYGGVSWPGRSVGGGPAADVVLLGTFPQAPRGGIGPVVLEGGDGADWLVGSVLSDTLRGGVGDDVLHGGAGFDLIEGGAGNDAIDGGAGGATLLYGTARRLSTVAPGTVSGPGGSDTFRNAEVITFTDGTVSIAHRSLSGQVWRLYGATLDRAPDADGFAHWNAALVNRRADPATIAADFLGSAEFAAEHGAVSDGAFVQLLYRNALGRDADPAGLRAWTAALGAGTRRQDVAVAISESEESIERSRGPIEAGALWFGDRAAAQAARLYDTVFGRVPDDAGLAHWTAVAKQTPTQFPFAVVAERFLASPEFQNRAGDLDNRGFVDLLYRDALDRPPDEAGAGYWSERLDTGAARRAEVAVAFSESREHVALTTPLIDGGIVVA